MRVKVEYMDASLKPKKDQLPAKFCARMTSRRSVVLPGVAGVAGCCAVCLGTPVTHGQDDQHLGNGEAPASPCRR